MCTNKFFSPLFLITHHYHVHRFNYILIFEHTNKQAKSIFKKSYSFFVHNLHHMAWFVHIYGHFDNAFILFYYI